MCLPIHGKKQYKRRLFKSRAFLFPKIKNWGCVCVCVCVQGSPPGNYYFEVTLQLCSSEEGGWSRDSGWPNASYSDL